MNECYNIQIEVKKKSCLSKELLDIEGFTFFLFTYLNSYICQSNVVGVGGKQLSLMLRHCREFLEKQQAHKRFNSRAPQLHDSLNYLPKLSDILLEIH